MFLYLLNDKEGKAFMELAVLAMGVNGENKDCEKAEIETYLVELNLTGYKTIGMKFEEAASLFKFSSTAVKRIVIIELCGILYADKEIDSVETKWIYNLSNLFNLNKLESDRLVRWSKDFSDFLEIGLMYINAKQ